MSGNFVKAASARALKPGSMQRIEMAGKKILLANVDGQFYAMDDTCSHEDASLCTGSLKGELVKCPLHGSRFNVRTGEVLEEPAVENLHTYMLRVEGDDILIALA